MKVYEWEDEEEVIDGSSGDVRPPYTTGATIGKSIRGPFALDGLDMDDGSLDPIISGNNNKVIGGVL